jgi:hypothetical protein
MRPSGSALTSDHSNQMSWNGRGLIACVFDQVLLRESETRIAKPFEGNCDDDN